MSKVVHLHGARPGGWAKERWRWIGAVMAAPGLNATAKLIAVALAQGFANHETAECRPGLPALMAAICAPKRTVMQALADLRDAGWIAPQGGNAPGKVAGYVFRWPGQVQPSAPEQVQDIASTGAVSCTPPIPPYKDQPNMNHNARPKSGGLTPRQLLKGMARPAPHLSVLLPFDDERAAEWDGWLAARGYRPLASIGRKVEAGMLTGWDLPFKRPPSAGDVVAVGIAENYAKWLSGK